MELISSHDHPAPKVITHHNFDADIQSEQLNRWEQLYDQLSPGPFTGTIRELQMDQLHLFCESSSSQLRQQCVVNKQSYWFGFSLEPQHYHINEKQVAPYQLLASRAYTPFELITPEDFSIYSVVLEADEKNPDSAFLMQHLERIEGSSQPLIHSLDPANMRQLYNLRAYFEHLAKSGSHWRNVDTIQKLVTDAIMQCLIDEHDNEPSTIKQVRRTKVVKELKNLVDDPDLSFPITISELCSKLYISRRALQYACEEKLGCSLISSYWLPA
ncbi:transcriptional regulator AraC family [Vibrio variabilis]|uniref:Transcriptional regulator AraC family n=1 Tax=Vibrio variabilis TaxID=990271 RepID=A0ABQ0JHJ5_9VIBR|nr:transcriptional regulator AraC family [Vibrio variabilis]